MIEINDYITPDYDSFCLLFLFSILRNVDKNTDTYLHGWSFFVELELIKYSADQCGVEIKRL